jgi:SAM-dependent methyltransferase
MPTDADIEYVEADILNYEPAEPFDVVLCVGVLAHVSSPVALIDRVARALRPGGRCIIQITDDGHPFGWLLNRYYRRRKRSTWTMNTMTRRAINSVLANHGFREGSSRRYGLLLPGSGWLPERWRYRLEASAAASGFGGELLMCFQLVT